MTSPIAAPLTYSPAAALQKSKRPAGSTECQPQSSPFAGGVSAYADGDRQAAIRQWREALAEDPANHVIRKQIWVVQNPDRFLSRDRLGLANGSPGSGKEDRGKRREAKVNGTSTVWRRFPVRLKARERVETATAARGRRTRLGS